MPRPRKSINVLELKGSTRKNPKRYRNRGNEVEGGDSIDSEGLEWMNECEARHYSDIVRRAPWLCRADTDVVAMIACIEAEIEADYSSVPASKISLLLGLLNRCWMTPASRAAAGIGPTGKGPQTGRSSEIDKFK